MRESLRIYLLALTSLIYVIGVGGILAALPIAVRRVGGGSLEAGAVIGIWAIVYLISSLPAGLISDRVGPRKIVPISLALNSPLGLLFILWRSTPAYLLGRALEGALESLIWTGILGFVAKRYRVERLGSLGIINGSMALGLSIGPALSSPLIQFYGVQAPFLMFAACSSISSILSLISIKESPPTSMSLRGTWARRALGEVGSGVVVLYLLAALIIGVCESSTSSYSPKLVSHMGLPESSSGLLLSLYYTSGLIGQLSLKFLYKAVERRMFPAISYLIASLAFTLFQLTGEPIQLLTFFALIGLFNGINLSRVQGKLCGRFGGIESTAIGFGNMAWAIGYAFGAPIYALSLEGVLDISSWLGSLAISLFLLSLLLWPRERLEPQPTSASPR